MHNTKLVRDRCKQYTVTLLLPSEKLVDGVSQALILL